MKHEIGTYLISPLLLVLLFSGLAGLLISFYLLKYRKNPGTLFLSLMQFSTALWTFFYGLEYAATEIDLKIFWSKFSYIGIVFAPVFFYFFSLHFANKQHKLKRFIRYSLPAIAILFMVGVATNDYHHLHWQSYSISTEYNTTIYQYGILFWMVFAFNYFLLILSIANIIPLVFKFPENFQMQIALIITACIFPVIGNMMYVFDTSPIPGFDWTPIFFVLSGIMLSYINIRYGTFDLIPFARNKLLDTIPDGILVIDKFLRVADVNPAFLRLIREPKEGIIGRPLIDVFPKRTSLIEQLSQMREIPPMELETIIDGQNHFMDMRISSLYDHQNNLSGRLVIFRDITEKTVYEQTISKANKQLKQEIKEKEKLISDLDAFDHTVAHDLNNVIGAIVTSTDLLQYEIDSKNHENLEEIISLIKLSANKSFHVIKELLTLASVRQQDVRTERIDMQKIFEESEKRVEDMIKTSKATIIKPDDWPSAYGYGPWIEEVWVNFLSNAIKYGGKPPVIELGSTLFYSEKKIRYWIKDNGNGLTKDKQQKLFQKYERFNQTHIEGTGLGLSIVKRIIEKLGGDVGVLSNAIPGEGCIFYFTLPQEDPSKK
ncbi:histidine kinase N-terminal 7TM domain-containing protein [Sunxiuqinia elliptica]|uniref:histidine kinase n=1 Tax=Sunxiuqinia elliptica TaxID=655355 RepID=A0A4R6HAZ0_9BACT|nr:histidine kinase N-terminal 7TM domain-containing protein [Sunxiuqinia elliptica]TDO04891.1 PAS domain S-box-containing protein [Sunxiuqinia elliptica]TDO64439.1 PAS domain S-box-containing protein [Sunxiuqinia elliptica]